MHETRAGKAEERAARRDQSLASALAALVAKVRARAAKLTRTACTEHVGYLSDVLGARLSALRTTPTFHWTVKHRRAPNLRVCRHTRHCFNALQHPGHCPPLLDRRGVRQAEATASGAVMARWESVPWAELALQCAGGVGGGGTSPSNSRHCDTMEGQSNRESDGGELPKTLYDTPRTTCNILQHP